MDAQLARAAASNYCSESQAQAVGALGWLLILSKEPMTASNPEHVAFTARVRELLDRAGLIERPEPEPEGW
ncbi:immunity 52 family protein [Archangium violaceum]|nr:immunity 52 family protein [Archangium violaceum]QRK09822.1 immunity 52 family protein [Archangium violaceum]